MKNTAWRAKIAVVMTALLSGLPTPTGAQTGCDGAFHVTQTLEGDIEVLALDFSSPSDGWGVGFQYENEEATREFAYVTHYDGGSWQTGPTPSRPTRGTLELNSVSALAPDHVWVSGFRTVGGHNRTYVSFWDGSSWSQANTPNPGIDATLRAIHALAPDDVWAVGHLERRSGEVETLALHFDGAAWTRIDTPSPGRMTALMDIGASSSSDVWAVGSRGNPDRALAIRYDGEGWSRVRLPAYMRPRRNESTLDAVHAVAPGDVWMTGYRGRRRGSDAVALHWDGAWKVTSLPDTKGHERAFDLSAARTDSVWAVGWRFVPEQAYPYAARWDGTAWNQVGVPHPDEGGTLEAMAFDGDGFMWAVGSRLDEDVMERACVP